MALSQLWLLKKYRQIERLNIELSQLTADLEEKHSRKKQLIMDINNFSLASVINSQTAVAMANHKLEWMTKLQQTMQKLNQDIDGIEHSYKQLQQRHNNLQLSIESAEHNIAQQQRMNQHDAFLLHEKRQQLFIIDRMQRSLRG